MKKIISIIIPFFNEENVLSSFINELNHELKKLSKYKFEILLMDNASTDKSKQEANFLASNYKNIKVFRQTRNFGYQANILAGYYLSKGDAVIQIDADGEDDPKVIKKFIENWEDGYTVVYGIRRSRKESFFIHAQRKIFYRILKKISDINIPIDSGDFRLLDRSVVEKLKQFKERSLYLRGIISYIGGKQIGILYDRGERKGGKSKFNWLKYVSFALNAITSFSNKPLYLIAFIGFAICAIASLAALFYLVLFISGTITVKGFTSIILLMLFFNVINIMALGIISTYLARLIDEVRERPRFIIEDKE